MTAFKGSPGSTMTFAVPGGQSGRFVNFMPGMPTFTSRRSDRRLPHRSRRAPSRPDRPLTGRVSRERGPGDRVDPGRAAGRERRHHGSCAVTRSGGRCRLPPSATRFARLRGRRDEASRRMGGHPCHLLGFALAGICLPEARRDRERPDRRRLVGGNSRFAISSPTRRPWRDRGRAQRRDRPSDCDLASGGLGDRSIRIRRRDFRRAWRVRMDAPP